jgi:hypothetical protein
VRAGKWAGLAMMRSVNVYMRGALRCMKEHTFDGECEGHDIQHIFPFVQLRTPWIQSFEWLSNCIINQIFTSTEICKEVGIPACE